MLKIRRPLGRLIFNMGITIPGKTIFLIEMAPWLLASPRHPWIWHWLYWACDYLSMLGFNLNHISIKGPWYTGIVNACGKILCNGTLWSLINGDAYDFKQLMKIWWAFKTDYLVAWSPGAFGNIGYPSETHLKRKSREISFAHNNRIKSVIVLKFCTGYGCITAMLCDWSTAK